MKLEKHVGGMSRFRKANYLHTRGWTQGPGEQSLWLKPGIEPQPLAQALHLQLTQDLIAGLEPSGWKAVGFSKRGYAQMVDTPGGKPCSLPKALRRQAKREGIRVAEFTYALFLSALL